MNQQDVRVTKLPRRSEPPITSNSDIRSRSPRNKRYFVPVEGQTGLRLKIEPSGTKVFVTQAKDPIGRTKSMTIGKYPEYDLAAAKKQHSINFQAITQGRDLKLEAQRSAQAHQRLSTLQTSFVQLCRQRADTLHANGGLTDRSLELEYNTIRNIENVLGKTSLLGLTEPALGDLRSAYLKHWASLIRVKKMIIKVYNSLDRFTQEELGFDLAHRTEIVFGAIKQQKRSGQYVPLDQLSRFWAAFTRSDAPQTMKDAYLMMLLTGERRSAVLNLKWKNVHLDHDVPHILFQSKAIKGDQSLNAVPIVTMLGVLLERLAADKKSDFVFPSTKGSSSGAITSVKALVDEIRSISGLQHVSPHDIRRTLAQVTRDAYGLTAYADEHILHSSSHYSGSTANYLDPNAIEFTARRAETYKRTYEHLDDLILSNTILEQTALPEFVVYLERTDMEVSAGGSVVRRIPISTAEDEFVERIESPVASACGGESKMINVSKRPKALMIINQGKGLLFGTMPTRKRRSFEDDL